MNRKPILILVDSHGYYSQPLLDRLTYEQFTVEIIRTFSEEDTLSAIRNAGPERKYIIITDSLTASSNATDSDRANGTYSMIKNFNNICPNRKVIINSMDFFELDTKLSADEVEFIDVKKKGSYELLIRKIREYTKLN